MRKIAIIGSGQSALVAAHGLLQAGHEVTLYSDRTAESWLGDARPTGTAVRFAQSLDYERALGLDQFHAEAPKMDGLKVTVCSHPQKPILTLHGRFPRSPLAIDLRLQSATWMDRFAAAGGTLVIEKVTAERVDAIARAHDLTIVATGKEGGALFARDPVRSPATAPLRHLAMVNCEGPSMRFPDVPFLAAKFNIFEGLGECYWTPYYHKDRKPLWNLVFEAKPGTSYDRFGGAKSGEEVLRISKEIVRELMPWDHRWIEGARLADPQSFLVGAITPTVRDPVGKVASGRPVIPLGDAYMAFDPLGAQGANMGNRLASTLVAAIGARKDEPFDAAWIRRTYDTFFERWGGPSMRWTHLLLEPMSPGARYLMLAQLGADGLSLGGSPKQRVADAFAGNFDDPKKLCDTLADFGKARRWVAETMGRGSDWEAAKGLFAVGGRQLRNTIEAAQR
ncbi:putative oxygenase subunit protein [Minicystis rosea]|nr:putative oxygenase subunit protein [Minicystis rosea]